MVLLQEEQYLKERRIKHYSNHHKILLVGEGNFSFATSLATAFGYAPNLTATSLDSRETVVRVYADQGDTNLRNLEHRGAVVIHGVDANKMNNHRKLQYERFDRIIFSFPHAGGDSNAGIWECSTWYIECHQRVVSGFLKAAKHMLSEGGEIHITHKTTHPYSRWDVVGLAENEGLMLKREDEFYRWDYPGYINKKAYGRKWNKTFKVGECSTFMFCNRS